MKILCTADLHIGRRSSRLPPLVDGHAHSAREAWYRIVDLAIEERVDLLAISGDVIDHANRFYEATGTLERGLRKLADQQITTIMVSGNHDHAVLPTIVDRIASERIILLGQGGVWQRRTLTTRSGRLHVDGWSFPAGHYSANPLSDYSPSIDGTPTLVLLHADLDQPGSRYAPISVADLRRYPAALFLLGHLHAPSRRFEAGGARFFYPGSPQALDPGESGAHGVALLTWAAGEWSVAELPISTVRYEGLEVSVEGAEAVEEIHSLILEAVVREAERIGATDRYLQRLSCRIRLVGATALHAELTPELFFEATELDLPAAGVYANVEQVRIDTRPLRAVHELAAGIGLPGMLARLLLGFEGEGPEPPSKLLDDAASAVHDVIASNAFAVVREGSGERGLDPYSVAREELHRAAALLLDRVLGQKEKETA